MVGIMSIELINLGYVVTLLVSFTAVVTGTLILLMGTKGKKHYFPKRPWAYVALNASVMINCFFIYNILLWLADNYVEIKEIEFHVRWWIYHTLEKIAIFLFHHDLYKRVRRWRVDNAVT